MLPATAQRQESLGQGVAWTLGEDEERGRRAVSGWRVVIQAWRSDESLRVMGILHSAKRNRSSGFTITVRSALTSEVILGPEKLRPQTCLHDLRSRVSGVRPGLFKQFLLGTQVLEDNADLAQLAAAQAPFQERPRLELKVVFLAHAQFARRPVARGRVPDEESEVIFNELGRRFVVVELLGRGSFGSVYKAARTDGGSGDGPLFVAIKASRVQDTEGGIPVDALREVLLLRTATNHPNIVAFDDDGPGVYQTSNWSFIVMEHMDMDLRQYIREYGHFDSPAELRAAVAQCCEALHHCHIRRVVHRDLKPQNILVNVTQSGAVLKLADFGLARRLAEASRPSTAMVVTLWYRPPELLLGHAQSGAAIDIWSLGCVLHEMASGHALFPADSEIDCLFRQFRLLGTPNEEVWPGVTLLPYFQSLFPVWRGAGLSVDRAPSLGADGVDLLRGCLTLDPTARLVSAGLLRHRFLAGPAQRMQSGRGGATIRV